MQRRWRLRLPIAFGSVSLPLFAWDVYNQQVIQSAGMAFDTGVPIWPLDLPRMLLHGVHLPAAILAYRLARIAGIESLGFQQGLFFALLLVWWWWVGTRLDFGLIRAGRFAFPRTLTRFFSLLAAALATLGSYGLNEAISWWNTYSFFAPDPLLRLGFSILGASWFFVLAVLSARAAWLIRFGIADNPKRIAVTSRKGTRSLPAPNRSTLRYKP